MAYGADYPAPTPASGRGEAGTHEDWVQRLELERELHDGAALRLSALSVRLGAARHRLSTTDPAVDEILDDVHEELVAALQDLRRLGSKLYPPVLHASGLAAAINDVAIARHLPVEVEATTQRFGPTAEGAAYCALLTCLPIVCRARARVAVDLGGGDGRLTIKLAGRPHGLAHDLAGEAVDAVSEDVAGAGGTCEVIECPGPQSDHSREDAVIVMELPCE